MFLLYTKLDDDWWCIEYCTIAIPSGNPAVVWRKETTAGNDAKGQEENHAHRGSGSDDLIGGMHLLLLSLFYILKYI